MARDVDSDGSRAALRLGGSRLLPGRVFVRRMTVVSLGRPDRAPRSPAPGRIPNSEERAER